MYEALWGAIFLLVIGKISHAIADYSVLIEGELRRLDWWVSAFLNVVGVIVAVYTAGPIFGLLGFGLEYWGASIFFEYPESGLVLIGLGAGIVVVGRPAWQGLKELWSGGF